ncbi:MAG TPA: hypothetical protein PKY78_05730 [Candidatus Omnitrophota bacterium]|nr:hypothetical protein [Candidatus Omnitrophota bacterium]HPS20468.1 hypothetical protein [Candidatus Omnitrophota bacterium]
MRYITVIKVTCEAADAEDAYNAAGEYLRGNEDRRMSLKCKTSTLLDYHMTKYGFMGMMMLVIASVLILVVTPLEGKEKNVNTVNQTILGK